MAVIKGYTGSVDWTTVAPIASDFNIHAWTLDVEAEGVDITDFTSSGWREFTAGLKGWSGSCECFIDGVNLPNAPADIGTSADIKLYINATKYFNGTAICTGIHPSVSVDGVESITMDFQGTGALSLV